MADYQQITDSIRACLGGVDLTRNDELVELASAYAALCRDANDRLRRCVDYLHRGLRSEAIHQADMQPPLLDVVAALDMPELPEWENLCAAYDMPRAPKLMLEAAQEINEAYAADQPLQALLSRHRILALAKAPLPERIATLRELASKDAVSGFWDDDIRAFETTRVRDLHAEAATAIKAHDAPHVRALLNEVEQPVWRIDVPSDLHNALRQSDHALRQAGGVEQLRELLPQLEAAFSAMSFDECNGLATQWQAIVAEHGLTLPSELVELAQPALDWVAEQRKRREQEHRVKIDCFHLVHAIEHGADVAELEQLHRKATSHGMPIPDEVQRRYADAIAQQALSRRRRSRRNLSIVAAVVVVVVAIVGVSTYRGIQSRRAQNWARQITGRLSAGDLAQADEMWKQMAAEAPTLSQMKELASVRARLQDALKTESERAQTFSRELEAARITDPDGNAPAHLTTAEKLAKTNEEKLALLEVKDKIDSARRETQQERDQRFQKQLDELVLHVTQVEGLLQRGQLDECRDPLAEGEKLASELSQSARVSDTPSQMFRAVKNRLSVARGQYNLRVAENGALERVAAAANSSAGLVEALRSFADTVPNSPRAGVFRQTAEAGTQWAAVEEWYRLTSQWQTGLMPKTPRELEERRQSLSKYLKDNSSTPAKQQAGALDAYLETMQKAISQSGPWKGELSTTLNLPLVHDAMVIRTADGKSYYVLGNLRDSSIGITADVALSNDVKRTTPRTFRVGEMAGEPELSPQAKLARVMIDQISALGPDGWETFGLDLAQLVRDDLQLDPIVKAILVKLILNKASVSAVTRQPLLDAAIAKLDQLGAEDVAWMNPDDAAANKLRRTLPAALEDLADFNAIRREVLSQRQTVLAILGPQLVDKGILLHDGQKLVIRATSKPSDGTELYAVVREGANADPGLILIGSMARGEWLFEEASRFAPEGTMVFLCKREKPAR